MLALPTIGARPLREEAHHDHRYDAIVIGAGHNGLTNAAYLAKEASTCWWWRKTTTSAAPPSAASCTRAGSTPTAPTSAACCPVHSPGPGPHRHGLMIVPYAGTTNFSRNGDYIAEYTDQAMRYREVRRHSLRDADAMVRYETDLMRYAKLIRHFLLRTPADPTSFKPRDLAELVFMGKKFAGMGAEQV